MEPVVREFMHYMATLLHNSSSELNNYTLLVSIYTVMKQKERKDVKISKLENELLNAQSAICKKSEQVRRLTKIVNVLDFEVSY